MKAIGKKALHSMNKIEELQLGDELAGEILVAILWVKRHKGYFITEAKKYWTIHIYNPNSKKTYIFKNREYPQILWTWKIIKKSRYNLSELLYKLVSKINL